MSPEQTLLVGFCGLSVALLVGISLAARSKGLFLGGVIWLALTGSLASSGWLADFSSLPPRIMFVLLPMFLGAGLLAKSKIGLGLAALPLGLLIGFQSFRILVELLIHLAVTEQIAPPQMTWTGLNLDVLSGLTAVPVALCSGRLSKGVLAAWNWLALGLLLWVVGVAILSFPTSFQRLHPDNAWIADFPFIWLPAACVFSALVGHLVLMRKLAMDDERG